MIPFLFLGFLRVAKSRLSCRRSFSFAVYVIFPTSLNL